MSNKLFAWDTNGIWEQNGYEFCTLLYNDFICGRAIRAKGLRWKLQRIEVEVIETAEEIRDLAIALEGLNAK